MSKNEKSSEYMYNKVPLKEQVNEKDQIPEHSGYGVRHVQVAMTLLCLAVNYVARAHLGVTVVAMTSPTKHIANIYSSNTTTDYLGRGNNATLPLERNITNNLITIYDWPKSTQEMVLGSFFVGYCIMTMPIGLVTQRWGGKIPLQIALFINGVVSIVAPWLTFWGGWKAVCFCRIMQGLSQAGVYPSVQTLLANWVPQNERATFSSYVYTGSTIGTVIAFQLAGFLGDSRWGWPSIFWAVGVICLLAFVFLTVFGSASPAHHGSISEEEKNYILGRANDGVIRRRPRTPWKAILTSKHLWGTLATHVGSGVSFVFMFTQVPSYIHYILGINVKNSGVLSSLPYVASFFTSVMFGIGSDYCTNRKLVTLQNARRISNTVSQVGIALSLVCASFTTSTAVAVTCLVVAMSCHMGVHTGWMVNHIDLAPNFSGTLMAIGNSFMNLFSVLLPLMVSQVVTDVRNPIQWRIMFFSIAGMALICNTIFVIFMSSDTQPWNDIDDNDVATEEAKLQKKSNEK